MTTRQTVQRTRSARSGDRIRMCGAFNESAGAASRQRAWKVVLHPRGEEMAMAAAALHASTHHVERFVNGLKETLKAPWTAEHRDAFAAAIGSLGQQSRLRLPRMD